MKISLEKNYSFWGLMNPKDLQLTLSLTAEKPVSPEIDETKLHEWEIKQIIGSLKSKRISISAKVEDLVKLISQEKKGTVSKSTKEVKAIEAKELPKTTTEATEEEAEAVVAEVEAKAKTAKKKAKKKVSKKASTKRASDKEE